jgi:DNA (cytosine-5)-methyltransferase 1
MAHRGKLEAMGEPISTIATEKGGCRVLVTPFLAGVGGRAGQSPERSPLDPYQTITSKADGSVVAPILVATGGPSYSGKPRGADKPMNTMTTDSRAALVAAFLAQHNGQSVASNPLDPVPTLVRKAKHSVIPSNLVKLRGTCRDGQSVTAPMATISAQGLHLAEVRAFLIAYYGNERDGASLTEPMRTTTSKERFGLVTVHGEEYVIADIGLRMLTPRELYRAQGFPDHYEIAPEFEGKPLSKTAQVRMCGNSVCPPNAAAMVRAQFGMPPMELAA